MYLYAVCLLIYMLHYTCNIVKIYASMHKPSQHNFNAIVLWYNGRLQHNYNNTFVLLSNEPLEHNSNTFVIIYCQDLINLMMTCTGGSQTGLHRAAVCSAHTDNLRTRPPCFLQLRCEVSEVSQIIALQLWGQQFYFSFECISWADHVSCRPRFCLFLAAPN